MILRELFARLGLKVDEASFAKGQLAADTVKYSLLAVVKVAEEVAHTFYDGIKDTIEYGDHLDEMSQSVGIATDALQELQYVASFSSISADSMAMSVGHLSRNMQAAAKGSAEASEAFKGIRLKDANGNLRAADDVLGDLADKFQAMPDGAQKTALSMQVFGRAGKEMIPFLNAGRDGLEKMRQEARDLGLVMSAETIKASAELADDLDRLKATTRGLWVGAIGPLIPSIGQLVKRFLAWRQANAAIIREQIQKWIGVVIKALNLMGDTVTLLQRNWESFTTILKAAAIAFAILGRESVYAAIKSAAAWAWAALPFVAITAAIAAIMVFLDDIRVYKKGLEDPNFKGRSVFGLWAKTIEDWQKPNPNDPWWLKAIKELVAAMKEALGLANKLGIGQQAKTQATPGRDPLTGRAVPSPFMGAGNRNNDLLTGPDSYAARFQRAFEATGSRVEGIKAGLGYGPYAQAPARVNYAPSLSVEFHVTTSPEQDKEAITALMQDKLVDWWNEQTEAADAALSR